MVKLLQTFQDVNLTILAFAFFGNLVGNGVNRDKHWITLGRGQSTICILFMSI